MKRKSCYSNNVLRHWYTKEHMLWITW